MHQALGPLGGCGSVRSIVNITSPSIKDLDEHGRPLPFYLFLIVGRAMPIHFFLLSMVCVRYCFDPFPFDSGSAVFQACPHSPKSLATKCLALPLLHG